MKVLGSKTCSTTYFLPRKALQALTHLAKWICFVTFDKLMT